VLGDVDALEEQLPGHGPLEVEPLADLLGGGEEAVDLGEIEGVGVGVGHRHSLADPARPVLAAGREPAEGRVMVAAPLVQDQGDLPP